MPQVKDKEQEENTSKWEIAPSGLQSFLIQVAGLGNFAIKFFKQVFVPPYEINEIIRQSYRTGNRSLLLVSISGFIIGLVMTLQTKPTMEEFGAEAWIPAMISISIIREIGPVLTGLICAGKVGSGFGAELGSMKVTEQIDAMSVSGTNPFKYLVVTRVLATSIMVPLLVFYADAIGLVGSYVGMNLDGELSWTLFISQALGQVSFDDIFPATIKTIFFGFAIGIVGCYKGYNSEGGTVGVGNAANSSVVVASLLIFIIDLIAVQIKQLFL